MKSQYRTIICILSIFAAILIVLSYLSWLGCHEQAARLLLILTGLAVAVTAVIALSNADPQRKLVKVHIQPYIDMAFPKWKVRYRDKSEDRHDNKDGREYNEHVEEIAFTNEQKDFYKNYPPNKPITSYVVQFRMTNNSGICLDRPVVTLWVPVEKQTPLEKHEGQSALFELRSNLYNSQADLKILEMAKEVMVSNSNLPYWPDEKDMTIWVRMVIENKRRKSDEDKFQVQVSINCKNADGFTKRINMTPKDLLENIGASRLSKE